MLLSFLSAVDTTDDRNLLANLYLDYYTKIKRTIYSLIGELSTATLLSDYTMVRLSQRIGDLRALPMEERGDYILQTAEHAAKDYMVRKASAQVCPVEDCIPDEIDPEEEKRLKAYCMLSQEDLLLLNCKELEMSVEDMAFTMGYDNSTQAVEQLQKAEKKFAKLLADMT